MTSYTSSSWTITDIISKVRNITGTPSPTQLTDQQIVDYVNRYYAFTMPFELKEQVNKQAINFTTTAYTDVYNSSNVTDLGSFITDEPMAYANGFPLVFYQDRDVFFQDWPQQYSQDQVGTGDGATVSFPGTAQGYPVLKGSFFITDGTVILTDPTGSGTLSGTGGSGTINYTTGAFTCIFTSAPATGTVVYNTYQAYQPGRPEGVLFYNNELTFRPVPDQVYQITLQGFISQSQILTTSSPNNSPLFQEWGELLALGASLDIILDRGDMVAYNNLYQIFKRYENVALGRYVQQLENQQSIPRF